MICATNIPDDGILRFTVCVADYFRHIRSRRVRNRKVQRILRAVSKWTKRRRGRHDWASRWASLSGSVAR